ncbi:multiubiquitin domain-containing protein [Roseomonas marmotae]|uniref:multiubiquitin domain-containing protein n=1 Tax=Roseomonas marmotae TaxID=2768161 RepID=UPI001AD605F0|nr:multiubiquitin domain-containing protein [Roseomonas marmotae]QTI78333.1 multiubiquitin domain-containing protein [Roseomonas marmotae]
MDTNDHLAGIDDVLAAVREDRQLRPGRYRVSFALNGIDFHPLLLDDPVPLGRQILKAAHLQQAEDHALFVITEEGDFEDVRPDEAVDLRGRAAYRFVAFSGDPLYRVKVNDSRIVWGMPTIPEAALRSLAQASSDEAVFLDVRGGTDRLIVPGSEVDLTQPGVEKFITAPHKPVYHFFVNGARYETDQKTLTGAEIKAMVPNWDATHDLTLEGRGDEPDRAIGDDESVSLGAAHGILRFSSVPKANFG